MEALASERNLAEALHVYSQLGDYLPEQLGVEATVWQNL
jgi:hypothetical protein